MKAIVIVFMPARNGATAPEQSLAVGRDRVSLTQARSEVAPSSFPRLPETDQTPAPFWTWFIENPRALRA
jgi:hypothetical protein